MQRYKLFCEVIQPFIQFVEFGNSQFKEIEIKVGTFETFRALIPIFDDVKAGDFLTADNWNVVVYTYDGRQCNDLAILIESFNIIPESEFKPMKYLNTSIKGLLIITDKCNLMKIGDRNKSFFRCSLSIENVAGVSSCITLVSFSSMANKVSLEKSRTFIDADVTVRPRRGLSGYELCIINYETLKEVE